MPSALKEEYISVLGDHHGRVFYKLWQEWTGAKDRLDEYSRLYDVDNVGLLNIISPGFFGDIQYILIDDLVLRLSRLTDKNSRSVSVHKLSKMFKGHQEGLRKEAIVHAEEASKYAESAKDWRNRKIAHLDMRRILEDVPLKKLNIRQIRKGLESVLRAMNIVSLEFCGSSIVNQISSPPRVDMLVSFLDSSAEALRFIDSRILQGEMNHRAARRLLDVLSADEQDLEIAWKIMRLASHVRKEDGQNE